MTVKKAKINSKSFPVHPFRFVILNIEGKKKRKPPGRKARLPARLSFFGKNNLHHGGHRGFTEEIGGFWIYGINSFSSTGAMIKKTAKKTRKRAGKKSGKKKSTGNRKQMDPAKVREQITDLVKAEASDIAEAVIDLAAHGELAPAKYLFEMAGIFPKPAEGEQATEEEDCLAKTLLARLDGGKKAEEPDAAGAKEEKGVDSSVTGSVVV